MYSALNGRQIRIDGNVIKNIVGMDMGAPMKIYRDGRYMVFKRAGFTGWVSRGEVFKRDGFTGWVSRGETGYYPPEYFLVETEKRNGETFIKEVIERKEVDRGTWLLTKNTFIKRAEDLTKENQENG